MKPTVIPPEPRQIADVPDSSLGPDYSVITPPAASGRAAAGRPLGLPHGPAQGWTRERVSLLVLCEGWWCFWRRHPRSRHLPTSLKPEVSVEFHGGFFNLPSSVKKVVSDILAGTEERSTPGSGRSLRTQRWHRFPAAPSLPASRGRASKLAELIRRVTWKI